MDTASKQDIYGTDLRLVFTHEQADLAWSEQDLSVITGLDNLVQALTLRLLMDKGDLKPLGHPDYGSNIRDFLGENMTPANRELMRRYIRRTLLSDPRVAEVLAITIQLLPQRLDAIGVNARVKAISGQTADIEVTINAG